MSTDTPAAAPTAERESLVDLWTALAKAYPDGPFRLLCENSIAALSAPVAAQPAAWLHEDGTRVLTAEQVETMRRGGGASASTAKGYTIPLGRMDAAQPAASGVDALWVEHAMELAANCALNVDSIRYWDARADLRTHLSTALTGAAKDTKC